MNLDRTCSNKFHQVPAENSNLVVTFAALVRIPRAGSGLSNNNTQGGTMKFSTLASVTAAMILTVSASAFAQTGSMSGNSMSSSNSMSSDSALTCQAMMDKAKGMSDPADANKKAMAMKEMDMAKMAMGKGQEKTCQMHMKKAMDDMM
jgi:hypothetical protein